MTCAIRGDLVVVGLVGRATASAGSGNLGTERHDPIMGAIFVIDPWIQVDLGGVPSGHCARPWSATS